MRASELSLLLSAVAVTTLAACRPAADRASADSVSARADATSVTAAADTVPAVVFDSVVSGPDGPTLTLSPMARAALDSAAPRFVVRRWQDYTEPVQRYYRTQGSGAPFAVTGDFNGDGRKDIALEARADTDRAAFGEIDHRASQHPSHHFIDLVLGNARFAG